MEPAREQAAKDKSEDLVVFDILRDSECAECGEELHRGSFLRMEHERPLCLRCADLDHLVYLPSGDAALTRRAKKLSALSAVVVRFSRTRGRYERQGILVEEAALENAEQECIADAGQRTLRRQREVLRRAQQDKELAAQMAAAIRELFPGCPPAEASSIAHHTTIRSSGRVGRTAAGRELENSAVTAAVVAAIRHRHTRYDKLLMQGWERRDARDEVRDDVERVLRQWEERGAAQSTIARRSAS